MGGDGHWTHTYTYPHVVDDNGKNACPYCLPRKRYKGTPQEETYWVHMLVTFVLIFEGFCLPIYAYPLKANQVNAIQNDDEFKQECELVAAHTVLRHIRERFPRTKFIFLGDALYANRPFIKLCQELDFEYIIVLKEKLKTICKKCDELAKLEFYQKSYTHKQNNVIKKRLLHKMYPGSTM